jgi:opacity protein-like surface antigen
LSVVLPVPAHAQIYFAVSAGGNWTRAADVTLSVPDAQFAPTYHDVHFAAKPFKSPQYYQWRLGTLLGRKQRFGVEFEFTHLKVISDTSQTYMVTGTINGVAVPPGTTQQMDVLVPQYQMTHGLNFLLFNGVARFPFGSGARFSFVARAGLGATLPHAESTVLGAFRQQYEWAGLGYQGAAGLDFKLSRLISVVADYKLSYAHPRITIVGGTGQTTALTSQVAFGLAFGFAR